MSGSNLLEVDDSDDKGLLEADSPQSIPYIKCSICEQEVYLDNFIKNKNDEIVCVFCEDFSAPVNERKLSAECSGKLFLSSLPIPIPQRMLPVCGIDEPDHEEETESDFLAPKTSSSTSMLGTGDENDKLDSAFYEKEGTDTAVKQESNSAATTIEETRHNLEPPKAKRKKLYPKRECYAEDYPLAKLILDEPLNQDDVYFHAGDIVSFTDGEVDYYAQIRSLYRDQYSNGYATITWLLPISESPKGEFHPGSYISGKDEIIPRKLDELQFVCRAPNIFWRSHNTTYPPFPLVRTDLAFIFKHTGAEIVGLLPNGNMYNPFPKSITPMTITSQKLLAFFLEPKEQKTF